MRLLELVAGQMGRGRSWAIQYVTTWHRAEEKRELTYLPKHKQFHMRYFVINRNQNRFLFITAGSPVPPCDVQISHAMCRYPNYGRNPIVIPCNVS